MSALSAGSLFIVGAGLILSLAHSTQAALVDGGKGPQLLIGLDDDRQDNAAIQAGAAANQSLNRTDVLEGGPGNDVMLGLNGNDVLDGGPGRDIILGGPDGGAAPGGPPNSDIMLGGPGDDVNLWAPGDGSETFMAGRGSTRLFSVPPIARRSLIQPRVSGCRRFASAFRAFLRGYPQRT